MFYRQLEEADYLDNSIILIYGDHQSAIEEEEYSAASSELKDHSLETVPLIISYPGLTAEKISKRASFPDLAPTILDLIGIDEKPTGFVGKSILDTEEQAILFLNERPLLIYKEQLYEQGRDGFSSKGSISGENENQELSIDKEREISELIAYLYSIMEYRRPVQ